MKTVKYIAIAAMLLLGTAGVSAKKTVVPRIYMFGFAASFNDTIVHFTNVQAVDSVWMDTKNKFLLGRDNYSYQLRNFLSEQEQMPNRTCIVIFGEKREKVEKKYLKMRHLYTSPKNNKQHFDVRYLDDQQFHFQSIDMSDPYQEETAPAKPEKTKPEKPAKKKKGGK